MAFTFRIDAERHLAEIHGTDTLTLEDFRSLAAGLRSNPAFGPKMRQLVMLEVTKSTIGFADWRAMREQLAAGPRGRYIAIVAVANFAFGVARQYAQSYGADDQHIQVFRDREAALAWLNTDEVMKTSETQ